ncbi:MtrB/PioB family outer membrane beta-barrel protein [Thioalkalivibrio sp.]|uniref:MtrB/PioB family outer membrane beta-barrel protein n=1 Tax=Thioalkalivibrio sp. TaxID=2093813 RepID=UPI0025EAFFE3|nr:MtrB/PioB family outer membrane beta-barrel protein [Thioalkalivibrio sp.]
MNMNSAEHATTGGLTRSIRLALGVGALALAPIATLATENVPFQPGTSGYLTPKIYAFDYFRGAGSAFGQFLEIYDFQRSMLSGSRRSGLYADVDFGLRIADEDRELLVLERVAHGRYNQRGFLQLNNQYGNAGAYYSNFRTASGSVGYLYNANNVEGALTPAAFFPAETNTNSGYLAQFNDDSQRRRFDVTRLRYGMDLNLDSSITGGLLAAGAAIDGYNRTGHQFNTYVFGGGDVREAVTNAPTPQRALQRWRGFDQDVDESNRRITMYTTLTPRDLGVLDYEFVFERYSVSEQQRIQGDVNQILPPEWQFNADGNPLRPLGFVPDSNLIRHSLRGTRNFGSRVAVAAGYGQSILKQESFTNPQFVSGFDGEISTSNWYVNAAANLRPGMRLSGFVRYNDRDNDSTFPAPGLITTTAVTVRINSLETTRYGLNFNYRLRQMRTTVDLGWERVDTQRDLTYRDPSVNRIAPERSLYDDQTKYDEFSLRLVSRIGKRTTLRLSPSIVSGKSSGNITDPDDEIRLRSILSHVTENGTLINAYYNYSNRTNDTLSWLGTDGIEVFQDYERQNQSAGLNLAFAISPALRANAGIAWLQDFTDAIWFASNRRRYEAPGNPVVFVRRDNSQHDVDTYVLNASLDWQVNERLSTQAAYTFTRTDGTTASGEIYDVLPLVDRDLDTTLHSFQLLGVYGLSDRTSLTGMYRLEYFDDDTFGDLKGGYHSIMAGWRYQF